MLNASPQEIYFTKYYPLFPKGPSPFPSTLSKFHRLFQNSNRLFQTPCFLKAKGWSQEKYQMILPQGKLKETGTGTGRGKGPPKKKA